MRDATAGERRRLPIRPSSPRLQPSIWVLLLALAVRAAWMAQEVLSTFSLEMGEVTLVPGTGGIFEIHLDGELIWERKRDGGFPDAKQIKQLVRDRIDPDRDLGHVDRPHGPAARHGHS